MENYERIVSCKMKGSFEKFHDWFYKWFFELNPKVQAKLKYDLPMDPKQQVWTTVKENEGGSKTRLKHKVTENSCCCCCCCFIFMVILMVIFALAIVTSTVKRKTIFL